MRQNIERQKEKEPIRMGFAKKRILERGLEITFESSNEIRFVYKGNTISLFPYSGWFQGKGLTPGRGIYELLKQLA